MSVWIFILRHISDGLPSALAYFAYQFRTLETMVHEAKADVSNPTSIGPSVDKNEKCSTRTRGSSSPFRCISSIVQQMNTEKDQELSVAKQRMQELEALAASQQKEVTLLSLFSLSLSIQNRRLLG